MRELIKNILRREITILEQRFVWTKDEIQKVADRYEYPSEFKKNEPVAYNRAVKNRWLQDVTSHMKRKQEDWTEEKLIDIISKYNNLPEFRKKEQKAYSIIKSNKWYHLLSNLERAQIDWTYDMVKNVAEKYENLKDFYTKDRRAYESAIRNGWLEDVTSHMKRKKFTRTLDEIKKVASQYEYLKDFYTNNPREYYYAVHKGWLDEVCQNLKRMGNLTKRAVYVWEFPDNTVYVGLTLDLRRREGEHMDKEGASAVSKHILQTNSLPEQKLISDDYIDENDAVNLEQCTIEKYRQDGWNVLNKMRGGGLGCRPKFWTKEKVAQEASKYTNSRDFKKNSKGAYNAAVGNKWLEEVTRHFTKLKRIGFFETLTDKELHLLAKQFQHKSDFIETFPGAYYEAQRRNIYDKITSHMTLKPGAGLHMIGKKLSDEIRKKMSQTHKERFKNKSS